MLVRSFEELIK